ncbi:MAG TPA: thioester reductase domain-containing protein [Thermoanaerobaculia bacterium]|jgi:thioester reductase-like protein|nr:thioester reductase domain-containing protein [Thermoanaerobaculia bacterium]
MEDRELPAGPEETQETEAIAVIGMAGRFPGAANLKKFWRNLRDGVESVRWLTDEDLQASGIDPAVYNAPGYVRVAAPIADAELFDAGFFGFSPREAEILDPQHRVFLECAWEALESAGYVSESYDGWIGVFAGVSLPSYWMSNLAANPELMARAGFFQLLLSNDRDYFATRISYKLGLRGPSVNVQTACSTSLVAAHLACQSLLSYQCSLAIAGGVRVNFPQLAGYTHVDGGIFSPDGHTRAFDAGGQGAMFGEGAGIVVLKRLSEALADGDPIHAVIRGSAYNNDGSLKVGYTAPSVDGQAEAIALAQAVAGVEPETISYVETHGSGTPLGDPIEVAALTRAFRAGTERKQFCAIGSVKTNVGHLEAAAGVAGLIKTVLALEHRTIPPSLHFETPNPQIDFANSPFFVNTAAREWETNGAPRRAGISSFGMGGTNVHMVVEEAPAARPGSPSRPWQLVPISAKTPTALEATVSRLAAHLRDHPEQDFADVAFTLQAGRRTFDHRLALVCRDREDALAALEARDPERVLLSHQESAESPVTFLFSGLGEHYPGMAQGLYETEARFREELDRCCEILVPHVGMDLRRIIFPDLTAPGAPAPGYRDVAPPERPNPDLRAMLGRGERRAAGELDRTLYAQPAVFAVEYALAKLLMEWGIRPQSLVGYSLGEYVAACVAGVLSLPDALALVARRARLIDGLPAGAMLAVPLAEEDARQLLNGRLSIAALNGPCVSVLAGPEDAIAEVERRLAERGTPARRLPTTHAFHSSMMEPIRDAFERMVREVTLHPPEIPYLSNVTGTWITAEEATDPGYWTRHMIQSVRFADALAELAKEPQRVLVEVGPGQGLTAMARQAGCPLVSVATVRSAWDRQSDSAYILGSLARLWLAGLAVDWQGGFHAHERRRRVILPTYPFERRRYFIDRPSAAPRAVAPAGEADSGIPASTLPRHERPGNLRTPYVPPASDLERRLAGIWEAVLGIEGIGRHDNFFELGGHSLNAPQLLIELRRRLDLEFPMRDLFESPTVAKMAAGVELIEREGYEALAAKRDAVDLRAEAAELDADVRPEAPWNGAIGPLREIFLTGATGFLGSHLLVELLDRTEARVHCLVRAADAESALQRLRQTLVDREIWREEHAARIVPVAGDLAEPRYGLSEEAFRALGEGVDAVYHCGAWVNFTYPYKVLKPTNVQGTVEAMRLASFGCAKPMHFVSSIAATPEGDYGFRDVPVVYEHEDSESLLGLYGGYGESKWVCERLVRIARSRGLPIAIYRPGVLSGHSRTGVSNARDLVWNNFKSCIQMGVYPINDLHVDVTPVDYVVRSIVHLSLRPENIEGLYQFPHPSPPLFRDAYEIVRDYGYPMTSMSYEDWGRHLFDVARVDKNNALAVFAGVAESFGDFRDQAEAKGLVMENRKEILFDDTQTRRALAGSGIVCPPLDADLFRAYLDYFVRTGFFPPPAQAHPQEVGEAVTAGGISP